MNEWISAVRRLRRSSVQDWSFPTDDLLDEYLEILPGRPDDEVRDLLRLFLFEESGFGNDESHLIWFWSSDEEMREVLLQKSYYRRLTNRSRRRPLPYQGIDWVLDLLPDHPSAALAAIDAYLGAHWGTMPDGRISGLLHAMAIIRVRHIGSPADAGSKQLSFHQLTSYDFERLAAALYTSMRYATRLTPPGRDGGRDVIASRSVLGHREELRVQVKLHRNPVGVGVIREMLGVVADEKANKGVVITSGTFTRGARQLATRNPRIELIRGDELAVLLNEHFGSNWPAHLDGILVRYRDAVIPPEGVQ
ncbi:MAG TPA: restriction endonuclease [Isosphaeraceae bacterium]|nr:restriction endonuclease [Isosphaeraceae bacterium]